METVSALLAICAGNSPVPGEFPAQRPVTRGFDGFFDLSPDKRLSKQSWGWWFETPSHSLWRHRNGPRPVQIGLDWQRVAFTIPTRYMAFTRYCFIQWILKLRGRFEIHWVRQFSICVVLFGMKGLKRSGITVKLKSYLYTEHVNMFLNFLFFLF